jgi:hypothetical protein
MLDASGRSQTFAEQVGAKINTPDCEMIEVHRAGSMFGPINVVELCI